MIQELKIKNFLSFKNEATLSFEATKDTTGEDIHVIKMPDGARILRFAMIYGANASGKSNLLLAFDFLSEFLFRKPEDLNEKITVIPFRLDSETPNEPSEFSLKFYAGEKRYWYQLSLNSKVVKREKLSYYTSAQPTMIFDREYDGGQSVITFNPSVVKISLTAKEQISLACLPNMSVFAARNQVNISIPEMDVARNELANGILPNIYPGAEMFDYAERKISKDDSVKKYLLDFIHKADFNITDVNSEEKKSQMPKLIYDMMMASEDVSDEAKDQLKMNKEVSIYKTVFQHTVHNDHGVEKYTLTDEEQSAGTKRIIGIESAIYAAMKSDSFINIDEIESSLHPELVEYIIQRFLIKHSKAQMLITTHYDPLLDTVGEDLIRKDSVWFTEKKVDGSTDLYSLVDFRGLNRISSLRKAYRNGLFGALPETKS